MADLAVLLAYAALLSIAVGLLLARHDDCILATLNGETSAVTPASPSPRCVRVFLT